MHRHESHDKITKIRHKQMRKSRKRRYKAIEVQRKWKTRSPGRNQVEGQRKTSRPCTTTTTNLSGQQGRCDVYYLPLSHHFGLVTLNQSAQGNLLTRSLDSRVSQRETNAHFNVKIGRLRKPFYQKNSFLKSFPHDSLSDAIEPQVGHPQSYCIRQPREPGINEVFANEIQFCK